MAVGAEGTLYGASIGSIAELDSSGIVWRESSSSAVYAVGLDPSQHGLVWFEGSPGEVYSYEPKTGPARWVSGDWELGFEVEGASETSNFYTFYHLSDIEFDDAGRTYLFPKPFETVLRLDPDGVVRPFAGIPSVLDLALEPFLADHVDAASIRLPMMQNVAMRDPWLYLALYDRHVVVRVHVDTGILERVAGNPANIDPDFEQVAEEGVPAIEANLFYPFDVAAGRDGEVFVLESRGCVRRIEVGGNITTYAGTCGATGASPDGIAATDALLGPARAIAADEHGTLYISDPGTSSIRVVYAEP